MTDLLNDISSFGFGIAIVCITLVIGILYRMLPTEDRTFMDPLPPGLLLIWPIVRVVAFFVVTMLPTKILEDVEGKLQKTGGCYLFSAEEFLGLTLISGLIGGFVGFFILASVPGLPGILVLASAILAAVIPSTWLSDKRRRRDQEIIRTLPMFLEFLSMCVDAGLNFSGALRQTIDKAPAGSLRNEFQIVLRDMRSGQSRAESLKRMESRLSLSEVTIFVSAINQAEKMGSSIKTTLKIQAEQRLSERFQRAEKKAMEAPVKLVIPLVLFIFPLTFVILLFPIIMRYMSEGGM